MTLSFATPVAALLVLAAVVPLLTLAFARRRRSRVAAAIGLGAPTRRDDTIAALALVAVAALLALAAAQPTIEQPAERRVRKDAEALFVLDVSRSMLAAASADAPHRLRRAKAFARRLRSELADIPVGIASLEDRVLPHLFPVAGSETFSATLERAIGIGRPPPSEDGDPLVTTLDALVEIPPGNYFSPSAKHRLVVVFSDGETRPLSDPGLGAFFRRPPAVRAIFVHVSRSGERVYLPTGSADPGYARVPASRATMDRLAAATGGRAVGEDDFARAAEASRHFLAQGPTVVEKLEERPRRLAPYVAFAAFLPLSFLLRRRNF
ncbi:MAG: VWA domain-containing protein [Actinomycetota bacterium]|nr:VWA domain-containing protein [Actinomycetota bacterium]